MTIRPAVAADEATLAPLVASFRVELAALSGRTITPDVVVADSELAEYWARGFPVFLAAADSGAVIGYLVCRLDGKTVWAESLYVLPEFRRRGVASMLFAEAERLAREAGAATLYNWVHPNNAAIIAFLRKRGYDVLNLVELRRPRPGEDPSGHIRVGGEQFRY